MSGIDIRPMEADDVERLVQIALAAWEPVYEGYKEALGPEIYAVAFPDWRKEKAGHIRRACALADTGRVDVAVVDGQIAGFVSYYASSETRVGEIGNNAVHPDYQSKGIGGALHAHAIEQLRRAGMRVAKVDTGGDPAHAPARRAYARAGFDHALPSVTLFHHLDSTPDEPEA